MVKTRLWPIWVVYEVFHWMRKIHFQLENRLTKKLKSHRRINLITPSICWLYLLFFGILWQKFSLWSECSTNMVSVTSIQNGLANSNTSLLLKNFIFVGYKFLELLYISFFVFLKNFIFTGYEFLELGR